MEYQKEFNSDSARIRQGILLVVVIVLFAAALIGCILMIKAGSPGIRVASSIITALLISISPCLVIAPLATFMMPGVKNISIKDGKIGINEDIYDLKSDSYSNVWICRSPWFLLMGTVIYATDKEARTSRFYWMNSIIDMKMAHNAKEFISKLKEEKKQCYEKYSYDYLCKSSSGNVIITMPVEVLKKYMSRNYAASFVLAAVFLVASLFTIHTLPVFITLAAIMLFFAGRCAFQAFVFRTNFNTILSYLEITQSGITVGNKIYSFADGLKIDFKDRKNSKEGIFEFGEYMVVTCGNVSDKYWIGLAAINKRQQVLLKYTLDMVTSYLNNYGAPQS